MSLSVATMVDLTLAIRLADTPLPDSPPVTGQWTAGIFGIAILVAFLVGLLAVWIWLAVWIGKKAEEKGYSRIGFTIFGLFFTLIALIVVLVIQPSQSAPVRGLVKCPHCAELVQPDARVCKHCGRDIPGPSVA